MNRRIPPVNNHFYLPLIVITCFFCGALLLPRNTPSDPDFSKKVAAIKQQIREHRPDSAIVLADALLYELRLQSPAPQFKIARVLYLRGYAQRDRRQWAAALADFRDAATLLQRSPVSASDTLLADIHLHTGLTYGQIPVFDSSEWHQRKSIAIRTRLYGAESPEVAAALNNLAGLYAGKSNIDSSTAIRLRALHIAEKHPGQTDLRLRLCNNLALLYQGAEDFEKARLYYERAEGYAHELGAPEIQAVVDNNFSVFLSQFKQYDAAAVYAGRADVYYRTIRDATRLFDYFRPRAAYFRNCGKTDSAMIFNHLQLEALQRQKPVNQTLLAHTWAERADDHWTLQQYDSCYEAWERAIRIERGIFGEQFSMLRTGYRRQGLCQKALGRPGQALALFQKSLLSNNYGQKDVAALVQPMEGCRTFLEAGKLCSEQNRLHESLAFFQLADSALQTQRQRLSDPVSKEKFATTARDICENGLETCWRLYQQRRDAAPARAALRFMEHTKSLELLEATRSLEAGVQAGIDPKWLVLEDSLKREISSLAHIDFPLDVPPQYRDAANRRLFELKARYELLLDFYKKTYKGYYDLQFGQTTVEADALVAYCQRSQRTILSYFQGETKLYVLAIYRGGVVFHAQNLSRAKMDETVRDFRTSISRSPAEISESELITNTETYLQTGVQLHRWLLDPVKELLLPEARIVVIPDGSIGYLPFETLLDSMPVPEKKLRYHIFPYSMRRYSFSYCFSTTLLRRMEDRNVNPSQGFLGIEPVRKGNKRGQSFGLPLNSGGPEPGEVEALSEKVGGIKLLGEEAGKEQFLKLCGLYRILHIVTHGYGDPADIRRSWLMLLSAQGDTLRLWEIYALRLQAEMVVLSACESGLGPLHQTEGLLSLGRGFAYTGAKCIVTTLWQVPDEQSSELMQDFYDGLLKGQDKDRALRHAQMQFLQSHRQEDAHPYYWAGYTVTGDLKKLF